MVQRVLPRENGYVNQSRDSQGLLHYLDLLRCFRFLFSAKYPKEFRLSPFLYIYGGGFGDRNGSRSNRNGTRKGLEATEMGNR
jgi:hypothetical protein